MEYTEALSYIHSGEAVLFTGSFFSNNCVNYEDKKIPVSDGLKEIFLSNLGLPKKTPEDLKTIAQYTLETLGPKKYGAILRSQFNVKNPSKEVSIISSKPWMAIFTTNYDNGIERASGYKTSSPSSDLKKSYAQNSEVYHVNGSLDDLSSQKDDVLKLLLSNDSYIDNVFLNSPGYNTFSNALIYAKAIFFVGYSVSADLDIARIIQRSDLTEKSFFITANSASDIEKNRIEHFGTYTGKTTLEFANDISEIPTVKSKEISDTKHLKSLIKVSKPEQYLDHPNIDNDLNELVDRGVIKESKILDPEYIVKRWEPYAQKINYSSEEFIMTVRSKIGNGKSIFMLGLAQYISERQNVFQYSGPADYLYSDLNTILPKYENPIVFIDNMGELRNIFGVINQFYKKGVKFVIADRSPVMEQIVNTLSKDYDINNKNIIDLVNLDLLKRNDFIKWTKNIDTYHLWGATNKNDTLKTYKHNVSFSKLLINIFNSSGILSKYQELFRNFSQSPISEQRLITSMLIFNYLNLAQTKTLLSILNILKVTVTEEMKSNEIFAEFFDFSRMEIINNSSILAREILENKSLFSLEMIYETILTIMREIDKKNFSKDNNAIQRALTSFSNLVLIFGGDRRNPIVHQYLSKYYSEVQKLNFAQSNVSFFIQLTNSKIYSKDYSLANKYMHYAETEAKRVHFKDDYQLVNTQINLYVEFSERLIKDNPKKFVEYIEWSTEQVNEYREIGYLITVFGKLADRNIGFLRAINTYAADYKDELANIIERMYYNIQFLSDFENIKKRHNKSLNLLETVINKLRQ